MLPVIWGKKLRGQRKHLILRIRRLYPFLWQFTSPRGPIFIVIPHHCNNRVAGAGQTGQPPVCPAFFNILHPEVSSLVSQRSAYHWVLFALRLPEHRKLRDESRHSSDWSANCECPKRRRS